jgi:hypothetical protein
MRAPILSPRLEYGLKYHGKVPVLWEFSFPYKIPFIKLSAENTERITRVFRLKSFFTALSTNISINYTARAVCPSLREPTRAEWRATNLFLSANKKPNYYTRTQVHDFFRNRNFALAADSARHIFCETYLLRDL